MASFALMMVAAGVGLALVGTPNVNDAAKVQKNVYLWSNGKPMTTAGGGQYNRQIVPLSKISKSMQNAVISAENASFYQDSGVDPMGIARAVFNMARGGSTQSGSTITQQYVKNAMLSQEQTIKRKVTELLISVKVGATTPKDDILAGYLNTAYYGRGAYGIQAAARAYYGKNSDELNPGESAFLAATLNGPNLYDPYGGEGASATPAKNLQRAETRWKWILDREVQVGRMTSAQRQKYTTFPRPKRPKPSTSMAGQNGYMVTLANHFIVANSDISKAQLDKGGYEIHTTFDQKKTQQLEDAVKKVRKEKLHPKEHDKDKYVQFGGASVEPGTGKIVAIYGGHDATEHYQNNADYTGVQVGSTFKPFVLTAAMTDGKRDPKGEVVQGAAERQIVSPNSVYDGDNNLVLKNYDGTVWHDRDGKEWRQSNDGDEDRGKITLRTAMQFSVNTPYIQLGMDVGVDKVRDAALAAGLTKDQLASLAPSFSLGTSAPSAIRLADAYATFASSGEQVEPYSVTSVKKDGQELLPYKPKKRQSIEANVANNVTDVLKNVVEKGTGTNAQLPDGRPVAGKTGTTDGNKSAWFAGYTPQLATTIGMWRVNDQAKNQKFLEMYGTGGLDKIHGASFPSQIWRDYMSQAMKNQPIKDFPAAEPIGKKIYGNGTSPSPSTSPTPSDTPSKTPPGKESKTPGKPSPSPSTSDTCSIFDPKCKTDGGGSGGTTTGGTSTSTSSPTSSPTSTKNGNGNGGFFGGPG